MYRRKVFQTIKILPYLYRLSNGSNVKVQQERVRKAMHELILYGGNTMINWVELSVSSCHMGRVVSWIECFLGRVVTRVELSRGSSVF